MKKMSGNTVMNIIAAILLLVTLIVVEISFQTAQGWFDTNYNPAIIALAVGGIILLLAIAALNITGAGGDSQVVSLLKTLFSAGACACAGVIVGLVLGAIATEFDGRCACFDIGYSGRLQAILCDIAGKKMDVFYVHDNGSTAKKLA